LTCDVVADCPVGSAVPLEARDNPPAEASEVSPTHTADESVTNAVAIYTPFAILALLLVGVNFALLAVSTKLPDCLALADMFPMDHAVKDGDAPRKRRTKQGAAFTLFTAGLLVLVGAILVQQNAPVISRDLTSIQVWLLS
jgi:hypothetical protein